MSNERIDLLKSRVDFLERENQSQQEMINLLGRITDTTYQRINLLSERLDRAMSIIRTMQEQGKDDGR